MEEKLQTAREAVVGGRHWLRAHARSDPRSQVAHRDHWNRFFAGQTHRPLPVNIRREQRGLLGVLPHTRFCRRPQIASKQHRISLLGPWPRNWSIDRGLPRPTFVRTELLTHPGRFLKANW